VAQPPAAGLRKNTGISASCAPSTTKAGQLRTVFPSNPGTAQVEVYSQTLPSKSAMPSGVVENELLGRTGPPGLSS